MATIILTDVFDEGVLLSLCEFLPPFAVISLNLTCNSMNSQIAGSTWLWRNLAQTFMGHALFHSHISQRKLSDNFNSSAHFYKQLFFQCLKCNEFIYAENIRSECLNSLSAPSDGIFGASGHTATSVANMIVVVGGWQAPMSQSLHGVLSVYIVDVNKCKVHRPELHSSSSKPSSRLRHSACVITRPSWLKTSTATNYTTTHTCKECLLIVGGRDFFNLEVDTGGVHDCLLLEFLDESGSIVKWHKLNTNGEVPHNIWHHSCCSFQKGTKVVMFGGDMPESDREFRHVMNRSEPPSHVYVLDIESKVWQRVSTLGALPTWRSLHVGVTYRSIVDYRERLVIVGGCANHIQVFETGLVTDFKGYALDLETMVWEVSNEGQSGERVDTLQEYDIDTISSSNHVVSPHEQFDVPPRMRFAAELYGRHLVVYGGHDSYQPIQHNKLVKLDLLSLKWSPISVRNEPYSHPNAISAQLAGGLLVGGIDPALMVTCEKFDFLLLA